MVGLATGLTKQVTQLYEIKIELQRRATTTHQAENFLNVAEERASAAVTAIGMARVPEQKKIKLNTGDAEKFWPETSTSNRVDKK